MLLLVIFARSTCPVLCLTQISLISKRHSLNTACMDALAHPCEGPTSGPQTLVPPYPTKQPLERLASGNVSDKKAHLHIRIQPVTHLRSSAVLFTAG